MTRIICAACEREVTYYVTVHGEPYHVRCVPAPAQQVLEPDRRKRGKTGQPWATERGLQPLDK